MKIDISDAVCPFGNTVDARSAGYPMSYLDQGYSDAFGVFLYSTEYCFFRCVAYDIPWIVIIFFYLVYRPTP